MSTWQEVGERVRQRREELGFAQGERPPSQATWRKVEHAIDPPYRPATLAKICTALGWTTDSIDRILRGEEPLDENGLAGDEAPPWDELLRSMRTLTETVERLADRVDRRG